MGDDDGFPGVQVSHQRFQLRIAEVLAVTVGGEFDAVRTERFQGIPGLSQCGLNIRQRESGAEEETFRIPGFQGCGFFIECPADGGQFRGIAEERLRGGHGQDGGPDTGLVHELQVGVDVPGRDGESFVHLHPVRFHGFQIGVRDHMAVHIDLRVADTGKEYE